MSLWDALTTENYAQFENNLTKFKLKKDAITKKIEESGDKVKDLKPRQKAQYIQQVRQREKLLNGLNKSYKVNSKINTLITDSITALGDGPLKIQLAEMFKGYEESYLDGYGEVIKDQALDSLMHQELLNHQQGEFDRLKELEMIRANTSFFVGNANIGDSYPLTKRRY